MIAFKYMSMIRYIASVSGDIAEHRSFRLAL